MGTQLGPAAHAQLGQQVHLEVLGEDFYLDLPAPHDIEVELGKAKDQRTSKQGRT